MSDDSMIGAIFFFCWTVVMVWFGACDYSQKRTIRKIAECDAKFFKLLEIEHLRLKHKQELAALEASKEVEK